jgi:hypothetical protein
MRLTLRTLLAYSDDRLSSENAREIGKKLKDSPFAQELADRIRTVVRQRRLTTPGRKIKMIDPNLIAEYLDDQLTPELVSLIEKEVLASDFSLAEAAASHEILGLFGDSGDLDDRLRQRLLKQSPHRPPDETTDHEIDLVARKQLSESNQSQSDTSQDVWKPLAPQRRFSPRSPALILAVLLVGWLALLLNEHLFVGSKDDGVAGVRQNVSDANAPQDGNQEVEANNAPEDAATGDPASDPPKSVDEGSGTSVATDPETTTPAEPILPGETAIVASSDSISEGATDGAGGNAPPEVMPNPVPSLEDLAAAETTLKTEASNNQPPAPEPAEPIEPVLPEEQAIGFTVDDPHGMLLSYDLQEGDWKRASLLQGDAPNWNGVLTGRVSALSQPFSSEITPDRFAWSSTMLSPCLFRFQDRNGPQLHLYDGRCVVVQNPLSEETSPSAFTLAAGGAYVSCSLAGDDLQLGILVVPTDAVAPAISESNVGIADTREADGDQEKAPQSGNSATLPLTGNTLVSLFVAGGSITIESEGMEPVSVGKGRFAEWTAVGGKLEGFTVSEPAQLDAIPDWVHAANEPNVQGIERAIDKLAKAMGKSNAPVETAHELSQEKNPLVASYATSILSVTREIDLLVQVLLQTDEEQVRIEAIHGIRQAAAQTLAGWQATSNALKNRLPRRDLNRFVRLLQGFSQVEAEDETTSLWALSMLRHERAAIRQLAFMNLEEITGERNGYHPDSDRSAISEATERWERWLKRNGNRLLNPEL